MREPDLSFGRAVVCVPARNEVETLPRLIRSLAAQVGNDDGTRLRVLVLANNCTDATVEVLAGMVRDGGTLGLDLRVIEAAIPAPEAHVGTARRRSLDEGAAWLSGDGVTDAVLLSTDADAVAPPDWVRANLRALRNAEIVGGRLLLQADAQTQDSALRTLHLRIEEYWSSVRALEDRLDPPAHDPAPRHGDHVAASLCLRAELYRAVGGLPAIPCGEDNALVSRVRAHGGRVRHCPQVSIAVSDRGIGRVQGGMATEMSRRARVAAGAEAYCLPPAEHWRALIERRRAVAAAYDHPEGPEAGLAALGLAPADIAAIAPAACPNAIALVERVEARVGEGIPEAVPVPLDEALDGLHALLGRPRMARVA